MTHTMAWKAFTEPFPSHFLLLQWSSSCLTWLWLWNNANDVIYIPLVGHNSKQTRSIYCDCWALQHCLNTWTDRTEGWSCEKISVHLYQYVIHHRGKNAPDRAGQDSHVMTTLVFWINIPIFINLNKFPAQHGVHSSSLKDWILSSKHWSSLIFWSEMQHCVAVQLRKQRGKMAITFSAVEIKGCNPH